jgi:hypothetical protein
MRSVFDKNVTAFKNSFDTQGIADIPLLRFLKSEKYKDKIEHLHTLYGKEKSEFKRNHLPCVTPSCTCSPRTEKGVKQHSGFIQFDIDGQDNTWVTDWPAARDLIAQIPEVAYTALSSSGQGVWGLVQIKYPEKHREHFTALEMGFKKNGYKIDQSCKNVTRLRYYSYDPDAIIKYDAPVLSKYVDKPKYKSKFKTIHGRSTGIGGDRHRVEAAIEQIIKSKTDITAGYKDWWMIGAAFINAFGEEKALEYFHAISQFHPNYDPEETLEQFNALPSHTYDVDLSIFFARCKDHGVDLRNVEAVCIDEARDGGSISAASLLGDLDQEISHPAQTVARHGGDSAPVAFEDDFTQHIRELAQSETAINSLFNLVASPTSGEAVQFDTRAALARFAEENGTDRLTVDQMKEAGDMFALLNTSYANLIEAFGLEYGEPIPLKQSAVPF